jgi:hypothetical protein
MTDQDAESVRMRKVWWRPRFEWKPQDCWLGVFWKKTAQRGGTSRRLDVWICLLPMLPLHFGYHEDPLLNDGVDGAGTLEP